MSQEAMKQALEALECLFGLPDKFTGGGGDVAVWRLGGSYRAQEAIKKLRQAIAEAEKQEHNFCSRCGKRLGKNDWDIHTCTPPEDA